MQSTDRGFSYVELTIVVLILGIAAAAVLPNYAARDVQNIEIAASELASAIRFARSQAVANQLHYGVAASNVTNVVSVFKADMTSDPVDIEELSLHPLTKLDYTFDLGSWSVSIANPQQPFNFGATGYRSQLLFDGNGTPVWHVKSTGTTYQLVDASIDLVLGNHSTSVVIMPYSGRVNVQ